MKKSTIQTVNRSTSLLAKMAEYENNKRMTFDVPVAIHMEFKKYAIENSTTMGNLLLAYVKSCVAKRL